MRIGIGKDVHRLEKGGRLILGGVVVSRQHHPAAHSDGDVLCHAIADALLGAAKLGDIGKIYPETKENEGMSSLEALKEIAKLVESKGWKISSVDSTVFLSVVRLSPLREEIEESLEKALGCEVSVKFKSGNGVGEVGRGEAVEALAVVLLEKK